MRQIKFRGKDLIHKEWIYGGIANDTKGNTVILPKEDWSKGGCADKNTVGQFTGVYDKNNKDIYEGDIVKFSVCVADAAYETYTAEVRYDEIAVDFYPLSEFNYCDFEVIGNIYDNPELLEEA